MILENNEKATLNINMPYSLRVNLKTSGIVSSTSECSAILRFASGSLMSCIFVWVHSCILDYIMSCFKICRLSMQKWSRNAMPKCATWYTFEFHFMYYSSWKQIGLFSLPYYKIQNFIKFFPLDLKVLCEV